MNTETKPFYIFEENFNSREEAIKGMQSAIERDGFFYYRNKIVVFDISQKPKRNFSSLYGKTMSRIISAFERSKAEDAEMPDLDTMNNAYFVCMPNGKSSKGTYVPDDYFVNSLEDVLGLLKESQVDVHEMVNQLLEGIPLSEILS